MTRSAPNTLAGQHTAKKLTKQGALHVAQDRSGWRCHIDVMSSLPGQSTDNDDYLRKDTFKLLEDNDRISRKGKEP